MELKNGPDNSAYMIRNYPGNNFEVDFIQQVDSVAHTNEVSSHFGKIYVQVMKNVDCQMQKLDSSAKVFVKKFEITFANYFLNACIDHQNKNLLPASEWKTYFSKPDAHPLQLTLLGINAHTNGDLWQALLDNFSEEEIRHYKKMLLAFQYSIIKAYKPFFNVLMAENGYLRFSNIISLGLDKNFIERMVYKWRVRQVNLAILFYHKPGKFTRRIAALYRKKEKIDRFILDQVDFSPLPSINNLLRLLL